MKPVVRDGFRFASPAQEDLVPKAYFIELPLMEKFDSLGNLLIQFFS